MSRCYAWIVAGALCLAGLFAAPPARADDISAAGRGVVRIVTIAVMDDEVVGFGHGSGFAVAPNRIVTNAHVVEAAIPAMSSSAWCRRKATSRSRAG